MGVGKFFEKKPGGTFIRDPWPIELCHYFSVVHSEPWQISIIELFVWVANGFKPLTEFRKSPLLMFNKALNVPLIFLALPKINASYLSTINDEKPVLKSSNFTLHKCYYAKKELEHLTLSKCCVQGAPWKKQIAAFSRGKTWIFILNQFLVRNLVLNFVVWN